MKSMMIRLEDLLTAAAMAEGGLPDSAREWLDSDNKEQKVFVQPRSQETTSPSLPAVTPHIH
ncbi:MAG: hypothetical protein HQL84_11065 [Magnetococcales bacterium]|nr:hypothetical protein [Magnetococcales bacterium]MBF0150573.1 hypothetical protein [Magnetococcales bacterium]MBF0632583.1 hypothetical protein [Magnetococcales bacterium]